MSGDISVASLSSWLTILALIPRNLEIRIALTTAGSLTTFLGKKIKLYSIK